MQYKSFDRARSEQVSGENKIGNFTRERYNVMGCVRLKKLAKKNNLAATLLLELGGDYHRKAERLREERKRLIFASDNRFTGLDVVALMSRKL